MKSMLRISATVCLVTILATVGMAQEWSSQQQAKFSRLNVFGKITVQLVPDGSNTITVDGQGIEEDAVKVSFKGKECSIKMSNVFKNASDFEVLVKVGYEGLNHIQAGGGAHIYSNEILDVVQTEINVTTGALFEAEIAGKNLSMEVGQGAQVDLLGSIADIEIQVNTGAVVVADELQAQRATLKTNTGGVLSIGTVESLKAKSSTGGAITYAAAIEVLEEKTSLGGSISLRP